MSSPVNTPPVNNNPASAIGELNEQYFAEGQPPRESINLNPIMREGGYRFLASSEIRTNRGELSVRVYALRKPENPDAVEKAAQSVRVVLRNHQQ